MKFYEKSVGISQLERLSPVLSFIHSLTFIPLQVTHMPVSGIIAVPDIFH